MIHVARRNLHGCRCRNPATTATLSSSERKRCSGVNDSRPIWTCSAGRIRMFRIQSASWPQAEKMIVLAGFRVVPQDHGSGGVELAGLPSGVNQGAGTCGPGAGPYRGDTAAAVSGRLPGRDDLVCGEARGVAWLSGRLEAKRQALPLSSPPNRHGPRVVLAPNERPALIFTPEANVLCWPGQEATSALGAGRGARAGQSACRMGAVAYCLCLGGTRSSAPAITEAAGPPAPPYRRSWSSHTSPQSYGRPSRRAKAAGLARDFGLARLRREVAAAATAGMGHPWRIVFTVLGIRSRIECEAQYHGS